jgi:hypothetical protein
VSISASSCATNPSEIEYEPEAQATDYPSLALPARLVRVNADRLRHLLSRADSSSRLFFLKSRDCPSTLSNRNIFANRCSFASEKVGRPKYLACALQFSWFQHPSWGIIQVPGNDALAVSSGLGAGSVRERESKMKKLCVMCVLALGLMMAHQQTASAWSEFKFSAGVNMGWVGGGNRILWGAYRSAPYPGGQDLGPIFPGIAAAANNNQYYGNPPAPPYPTGGYPHAGYPAAAPAPAAPPAPGAGGMQYSNNPYYNSGYQPVGYDYTGYSASQIPSYWYGR